MLVPALLSAVLFSAAPPVVWLEAESFAKPGGWSNDAQFVDLMGSPYLLATGVGKPVADAVTTAQLPAAGTYRLWVRAKDWLPKHSPGRFQVLVGGKASVKTCGEAADDAWQWIDGGTFDLPAGAVEVRLHDLTGWWGRCDAVVLAGAGFTPSNDAKTLIAQRETYGGISRDVQEPGPYDVVVVGGGLSGCGAAVCAARHGCRVAFIQDRPVLGGNASSEVQIPVEGDRAHEPWDPFDTGVIEEFFPEMRQTGRSQEIEQIVRAEKRIDLRLETRATGVEMKDPKTIAAVLALNVRSGQRLRLRAPLFVDCTGHGWVGYWAGADYRVGEDAQSEYHEPCAPQQATRRTMGNNLYAAEFRTHDKPVEFQAPTWAYLWTKPDDFEPLDSHRRQPAGRPHDFDVPEHGKGRQPPPNDPNGAIVHNWVVEYGGMIDTIADAEHIRDELFCIHVGLWNYAKNYNPAVRAANANRELVWMNYVMGTRESRRLLGDYVMTENDYVQRTVSPDAAAFSGWGMDVHHPEGFWVRGNDCMHYYRFKVSIPFRSLYSRNIDNLLMAGRCHSATHLAMGATRIMRTCCEMGQAVGIAAALCRQHACLPRAIYQQHIDELQQALLKDGAYLMGVRNHDPHDLALTARATASSAAQGAGRVAEDLKRAGLTHRLDRDRAVMFTATGGKLQTVGLGLTNSSGKAVRVQIALRPAPRLGEFATADDLATATADVPAKSHGWVDFALRADLAKDKPYYIYVPTTDGLGWQLFSQPMRGCCRAYRHDSGRLQAMPACYKFRLDPGGEPTAEEDRVVYGAENVNNGWCRAIGGVRNAWVPDLEQNNLPQWVELQLPRPAKVNTAYISFQTRKDRGVDFSLEALSDGRWTPVAQVEGNADRRRVLHFADVSSDKFRLVLQQIAGDAGVCEIRLYHEVLP